jgi:hypothetical protein
MGFWAARSAGHSQSPPSKVRRSSGPRPRREGEAGGRGPAMQGFMALVKMASRKKALAGFAGVEAVRGLLRGEDVSRSPRKSWRATGALKKQDPQADRGGMHPRL